MINELLDVISKALRYYKYAQLCLSAHFFELRVDKGLSYLSKRNRSASEIAKWHFSKQKLWTFYVHRKKSVVYFTEVILKLLCMKKYYTTVIRNTKFDASALLRFSKLWRHFLFLRLTAINLNKKRPNVKTNRTLWDFLAVKCFSVFSEMYVLENEYVQFLFEQDFNSIFLAFTRLNLFASRLHNDK